MVFGTSEINTVAWMDAPSEHPLSNGAFTDITGWLVSEGGQNTVNTIGVRISGDPASVPEPSTMFLLGFGLTGIAGLRRGMCK